MSIYPHGIDFGIKYRRILLRLEKSSTVTKLPYTYNQEKYIDIVIVMEKNELLLSVSADIQIQVSDRN